MEWHKVDESPGIRWMKALKHVSPMYRHYSGSQNCPNIWSFWIDRLGVE